MTFLATYWYVWLIALVVFMGLTFINQIRRMKKMVDGDMDTDNFTSGLYALIFYIMGSTVSAIMLVIGIIGQIIWAVNK